MSWKRRHLLLRRSWIIVAILLGMSRPSHAQAFTSFPLPADVLVPYGITSGPDGNLWFVAGSGWVGKATVEGSITVYPVPSSGGDLPIGITTGPDANLWFTDDFADRIGRITTAGAFTEFTLPVGRRPYSIVAGPDDSLWFTQTQYSLSRMSTDGNRTDLNVGPTLCVTVGPDQAIWFTDGASSLTRISMGGLTTTYPLAYGSYPFGIVTGVDGNLWFAEYSANRIGRITPEGVITEFPIPTPNSQTRFLTAGPDGNVWFGEYGGYKIGRITPEGTITEFPLPGGHSGPWGITTGSDDAIWFTEGAAATIVRMEVPGGPLLPVPVPDGKIVRGEPIRAWLTGEGVTTSWDVARCRASDYNLYLGDMTDFGTSTGGVCGLGTAGIATSLSLDGDTWWVIAGVDSTGTAISSFGRRPDGSEKGLAGWGPGGACPSQTRQATGRSCP